MNTKMRAKLQISRIEQYPTFEKLVFNAVAAKAYPADGSDEDNTYAKYSPSASLEIHITNPTLLGRFKPGEKYYVDFTPADEQAQAQQPA